MARLYRPQRHDAATGGSCGTTGTWARTAPQFENWVEIQFRAADALPRTSVTPLGLSRGQNGVDASRRTASVANMAVHPVMSVLRADGKNRYRPGVPRLASRSVCIH